MALAPQTADAGPRMTSICLMSFGFVGTRSHMTIPKKSRYIVRPSTRVSCEVASVDVALRLVMLTSRADTCVTFVPGTERRRSPTFDPGEFWIVELEMTVMAGGAFTRSCSTLDAVTTTCSSMCIGGFDSCGSCWASAGEASASTIPIVRPRTRIHAPFQGRFTGEDLDVPRQSPRVARYCRTPACTVQVASGSAGAM